MATEVQRPKTSSDQPAEEAKAEKRPGFLRRIYLVFDDRTGLFSEVLDPIMRHPVPRGTNWWYVFGSATLFAFIIQVVTGIALATAYIPAAGQAYASLQFITNTAAFGYQLRGIHNFGGTAMVILIGVHAMRVFLTGSYKFPREVNWLSGVMLLFLTLGMAFTGQLLRWDQNGVYSVIILVQQIGRTPIIGTVLARFILGGDTVGGATLSRFFSFHVFFIPALIFAFVGMHLHLVLRNGISEPPTPGQPVDPKTYRAWYHAMLDREGVPFWPDAAWRDAVFSSVVVVVIVGLAVLVGAPALVQPPNPAIIQAQPLPDWYFIWYFGALALAPAKMENYIIIGGPLALAIILIVIPFIANKGERSPLRRPWSVAVVIFTVMMVAVNTVMGVLEPWSPDFTNKPLPEQVVGTSSGPVALGAALFHQKGCEDCHQIGANGGHRGPNLSHVANRYTRNQLVIRILNGGTNMPAFGDILTPQQLNDLVAFLETRK